jgi:ribosomal-protein-alanine N-acetyltransferase
MPQYIVMAAIDVRGVILGYAICSALFDEIDIIFLGVALENRCCGIASQILNKIVNSMPALKRIYLEVDINNIGAMTFYRKKGFEIIRIRKMYANGRDAYEMMKKIYDIDL